jgi:fructan beta-fructosidase
MKLNINLCLLAIVISMQACTSEKKETKSVYYSEKYRPQFHFTPEKNWMNDPNGMVYYQGEYHLFYQYYPYGNVWGSMHWGHAISNDLVSWEHLPIALYPDSLGMIFSGSAVIDYKNTSGLGSADSPSMVAIFTQHLMKGEKEEKHDFQTQGIAYSLDKGRTWKMYEKNPVIKNSGKHDFRDPKVSWHEASKQWVMILAVKDHVELYGSANLIDWKYLSDFGIDKGAHGGVWECPDLFEIKIAGTENKKWVMLVSINPGAPNGGSGTQYFIGQFDGKKFVTDSSDTLWIDQGKDNYAGITWSNVPTNDGRRLFLGWMSNWQYAGIVPTTKWRSATTIVRSLELVQTDAGLRLASKPVDELEKLRGKSIDLMKEISSDEGVSKEIMLADSIFEINLTISRSMLHDSVELKFSNEKGEWITFGLEGNTNQFFVERNHAGVSFSNDFDGKHYGKRSSTTTDLTLRLLMDTSSGELFADDGTLVMTELFFPTEPFNHLQLTKSKEVIVKSILYYPIKSAWNGKRELTSTAKH